MNKKKGRLLTLLLTITLLLTNILTIHAKDLVGDRYNGSYDAKNPLTWDQCNHSWSNEIYPIWGETYCQSGCGAHALTWILLKSGAWGLDKSPRDAWDAFVSPNGMAVAGGGGYDNMDVFAGTYGGKKVETMGYSGNLGGEELKKWLRDQYNQGYYVAINVPNHFIALDYVDTDGDIVVLDSAGLCKYIECSFNRWGYEGQAWAYKVEGVPSNSDKAINFWEGDAARGGTSEDSGNNNSGGQTNGMGWDPNTFNPFEPLENPLVKYEENQDRGNQNKGVDTKKSWWPF